VSSNPAHGKVYSIQHYVIKFVRDLRQVDGFLQVLCVPQPIKLTQISIQQATWMAIRQGTSAQYRHVNGD
jgi:hypothetical protein